MKKSTIKKVALVSWALGLSIIALFNFANISASSLVSGIMFMACEVSLSVGVIASSILLVRKWNEEDGDDNE